VPPVLLYTFIMFLSADRQFYFSEISGSHSVVCEHSGILKGDDVLLVEWLPTFRRIIIYLTSGPRNKIPLKMKAVRSSETSETINLTTRHNIPEDLNMDGNKWWSENNSEKKKSPRNILWTNGNTTWTEENHDWRQSGWLIRPRFEPGNIWIQAYSVTSLFLFLFT
jgi:hypothetical protein